MKFLIVLCYALLACASAQVGRIVGGQATTIEARPYQASLQSRSVSGTYHHYCGASIISSRFLLSAANCVQSEVTLSTLYARVGSTNYNSGGQVFKVDAYTHHPLFSTSTMDYDFAIVSFAAGVEIILGPNVQVIQLTSGEDPAVDSSVIVSGWGLMNANDPSFPTILREVSLPVWSDSRCHERYTSLNLTTKMCMGGTSAGNTSPCRGDEGSPAVQGSGSSLRQYALVSILYTCHVPNFPGVFSRISSVRPWITEMTGV